MENTLEVIINNAASVDFDLRIDEAIQINFYGPQRLLHLAKRCKHLQVMTHVSTTYVNSDKSGYIDEKIYDYPNDPDEVVNNLLSLPIDLLLARTKQIISPWPNTYTFTKSLAERAL
jgi:fatty acyl-CoA reductase